MYTWILDIFLGNKRKESIRRAFSLKIPPALYSTFWVAGGVWLVLWAIPGTGGAEDVRLRLNKHVSERTRIAVPKFSNISSPEGSGGMDLEGREILMNDLIISGLFDTIAPAGVNESGIAPSEGVDYESWTKLGAQLLILGDFEKPADEVSIKLRLFDITAKNFLLGKQYQGEKKLYRWMIHRFADDVIGELTGIKGSCSTQIVFSSLSKGNKEIYVVDQDGYEPQKLTDHQSIAIAPTWSPDGANIAFTSYRYNNPNLFIMDRTGARRKMVSNDPGLNDAAAWSPDGEKIAYVLSAKGNSDIYLLLKDGTKKRITTYRGIDTSPAWSPDGTRLAFTSDRNGTPQIYILDVEKGDQGPVKRISYGGGQNDDPSWSPDGKSIAYTSLRGGHFEIIVEDMENNVSLQLTTTNPGGSEHPSWSPDGRSLVFSSSKEGTAQLYVMRSDGGGLRKLTFLEGGGFEPSWSPRFYQ